MSLWPRVNLWLPWPALTSLLSAPDEAATPAEFATNVVGRDDGHKRPRLGGPTDKIGSVRGAEGAG
jgi:hypothetical protein